MENKDEIRDDIKRLELILKLHSMQPLIKNKKEREKYVDTIHDAILELKKKLKE